MRHCTRRIRCSFFCVPLTSPVKRWPNPEIKIRNHPSQRAVRPRAWKSLSQPHLQQSSFCRWISLPTPRANSRPDRGHSTGALGRSSELSQDGQVHSFGPHKHRLRNNLLTVMTPGQTRRSQVNKSQFRAILNSDFKLKRLAQNMRGETSR